MYKILSHET